MGRARQAVRRDRRLAAASLALLVTAGGVCGWRAASASPPAPVTIATATSAGPDGRYTVAFAGDTLVGGGAASLVASKGPAAVFAGVRGIFAGADYVIANAEGPLTERAPDGVRKRYSYASPPAAAAALRAAGVNALGLANDHSMDRGPLGLADTQARAAASGLQTFGAGADEAEAERPVILEGGGRRIAVVAMGDNVGRTSRAGSSMPGLPHLSVARIRRSHDLARAAGADKVVAYVHWGTTYGAVDARQRHWATLLVRAGYDAVLGSGPHITQPVEVKDGVPIVYSLGNFVFGGPGRFATHGVAGRGLVAQLSWDRAGRGSLELRCLLTDNRQVGFVPRPCGPTLGPPTLRALNPALVVTGDRARLAL